jgi:TonB family protein
MHFARCTLLAFLFPIFLFTQQKPGPPPAEPLPSPAIPSQQTSARTDSTPPLLRRPEPANSGNTGIQILSDIRGVDFRFYLFTLKKKVQENWHSHMPYSAQAPQSKYGRVVLRFAILPDGNVRGLTIEESSGDESLDRSAYDAIRLSSPFESLPKKFAGSLRLRTNFLYNPQKAKQDSAQNKTTPDAQKDISHLAK